MSNIITRRHVLTGLIAAPAIVTVSNIMPVRAYYDYYIDPIFALSKPENTFACLVNGHPGLVTFNENMSQITEIKTLRDFVIPEGVNPFTFTVTRAGKSYPNVWNTWESPFRASNGHQPILGPGWKWEDT